MTALPPPGGSRFSAASSRGTGGYQGGRSSGTSGDSQGMKHSRQELLHISGLLTLDGEDRSAGLRHRTQDRGYLDSGSVGHIKVDSKKNSGISLVVLLVCLVAVGLAGVAIVYFYHDGMCAWLGN